MKSVKVIILGFLLVLGWGWTSIVKADTIFIIPYSSAQYHAFAYSESLRTTETQDVTKSYTPMSAYAGSANAFAENNIITAYSYATSVFYKNSSSFLEAIFNFSATSSEIHIKYDFHLEARLISGYADAAAFINSYLFDSAKNLKVWTYSQSTENYSFDGGVVDDVVSLIMGHDYQLFLGAYESTSASSGFSHASAGFNLGPAAVPIPATFLLLGSGLLGLAGWRRFRKG